MEPEFERDMQDILNELDAAEVVTIILPLLGRCLVLDGRTTHEDPPHLSVVPQAGSAERRLQQVNSARPHLPAAQKVVAVPWTGSVDGLNRSEIWERLVHRMVDSGFKSAATSCDKVLEELKRWEHRALAAMIRGRGPFHTLWSRSATH